MQQVMFGVRRVSLGWTTCLSVVLCAGLPIGAQAQASRFALTPQQQYEQDLQACEALSPLHDQEACRLEARNALIEARKGLLSDTANTPYRQNAQSRCDVFVGADRETCLKRALSPTREEGSVEQGGVLRESVTIVPVR